MRPFFVLAEKPLFCKIFRLATNTYLSKTKKTGQRLATFHPHCLLQYHHDVLPHALHIVIGWGLHIHCPKVATQKCPVHSRTMRTWNSSTQHILFCIFLYLHAGEIHFRHLRSRTEHSVLAIQCALHKHIIWMEACCIWNTSYIKQEISSVVIRKKYRK